MMGEGSLCTDAGFRSRLASVNRDQIIATFGLSLPHNQDLLKKFREAEARLRNPTPLTPTEIQGQYVKVLDTAAERAGRKSAYGLFAHLFGTGNWEACFPGLAEKRRTTEQEVFDMMASNTKRPLFSRQDSNLVLRMRFFDVGSSHGCYQWADGAQGYVCGQANLNFGEKAVILSFKTITAGSCATPGSPGGVFDRRKTIAVLEPCMKEFLEHALAFPDNETIDAVKKKFGVTGTEVPEPLLATVLDLVLHHENGHTSQRFVDSQFVGATSEKLGMGTYKEVHSATRELAADTDALTHYKGKQPYLIYALIRIFSGEDPQSRSAIVNRVGFKMATGAKPTERRRELERLLQRYDRELRALVDRKLKPYRKTAEKKRDNPELAKLTAVVQQEVVDQEAIRLFVAAQPNDREVRAFFTRWRETFRKNGI